MTRLFVASGVAAHLVATNGGLLDTQQIDETRVLTGLNPDLASLAVALGNRCAEVTITRNHDESHICLGSTYNHVLNDTIAVWASMMV